MFFLSFNSCNSAEFYEISPVKSLFLNSLAEFRPLYSFSLTPGFKRPKVRLKWAIKTSG